MAKITTKKKSDPDRILVCTMDFGTTDRVVKRGERVRARDPIVGDGRWFVDAETPESEWPNMWHELPAPPDHRATESAIRIGTSPLANVPPHLLVRATSSFWFDGGWAPGSPGEKSGKRSGFGWAINVGQLVEISNPAVRAHPEHFEWPRRDVTLADVERLSEGVR
jgi:hypothetical protein